LPKRKAQPVVRGRHAHLAPEQAAEKAGVAIADVQGHGFDRRIAGFQHLLGLRWPLDGVR